MKLSEKLLKKINGRFLPSSMVPMQFGKNDMILKTDEHGNAIQMFIGKADEAGRIKGDRYSRVMVYDRQGHLIRDHWERKGKSS